MENKLGFELAPKTLVAIAQRSQELDALLMYLGGELNAQVEQELTNIETQLTAKADAYNAILGQIAARIEAFKVKEDEYRSARKSLEIAEQRIRDRIKYAMGLMNKTEVEGDEVRFKLVNAKPSMKIVDEKAIPPEFKKQTIVTEVDKEMLRGALESGVAVPGACLTPSQSLRITSGPKREL